MKNNNITTKDHLEYTGWKNLQSSTFKKHFADKLIKASSKVTQSSASFVVLCSVKILTDKRSWQNASSSYRTMAHRKQLLGFPCQLKDIILIN